MQQLRQHDKFAPSFNGNKSVSSLINFIEALERDGDVRDLHPVFDGSTAQVEFHNATVKGVSHVFTG
jgi:hypothetical protein